MAKCRICGKKITSSAKVVRLVVEAAYHGVADDRHDPANWSVVEDWEMVVVMHLGCVQAARRNRDKDLPYGDEVDLLPIEDIEHVPVIAGVPRTTLHNPKFPRRKGRPALLVIEGSRRRS